MKPYPEMPPGLTLERDGEILISASIAQLAATALPTPWCTRSRHDRRCS